MNNQDGNIPAANKKKRSGWKVLAVLFVAFLLIGAASSSSNNSNSNVNPVAPLNTSSLKEVDGGPDPSSVESKTTITEKQSIPYSTKTVDDPTLAAGSTKIKTYGSNGERVVVFEVTSVDGDEINKVQKSSSVTKKPIDQIVLRGTKKAEISCSNGSYVNTYGNTVCRPQYSSSAPAGASAKCRDGTYSYSQSRRGTCSHHGGVVQWL